MPTLTLTADELHALTGYRWARKQLEALHARGFWRAYINVCGRVVLERAHYDAVCRGDSQRPKPKMLIPRSLAA